MSATAEIMHTLERCDAGIDEGLGDAATRISMNAATTTGLPPLGARLPWGYGPGDVDPPLSTTDAMKNAEIMTAMTEEEQAWAAQPEWHQQWA